MSAFSTTSCCSRKLSMRKRVLHVAGGVVGGAVVHPADLLQERLHDAVLLQLPLADGAALLGEVDALVGLVLDQPGLLQLLQHVRDAGRRDAEVLGNLAGAGDLALLLQAVDGLEILLHLAGDLRLHAATRLFGLPNRWLPARGARPGRRFADGTPRTWS